MNIDDAARRILAELRIRVDQGGDGRLYGNRAKALNDIDALLENPSLPRLRLLLAPTANLQELAIECVWGEDFGRLAAALENILEIG
jgi:hypothetical protein